MKAFLDKPISKTERVLICGELHGNDPAAHPCAFDKYITRLAFFLRSGPDGRDSEPL
jgi:hypothetical protein